MAKAPKIETATAETDTAGKLFYGDKEFVVADFPDKALMYLIQYGLNKTRQDSVAGMAKALAGEKNEDGSPKYDEAAIAAEIAKAQEERLQAILSGTLGARKPGAPKPTSFEAMVRKVAVEKLRAAVAAKAGFKLPTGEAYEKLVSGFTDKYRADIEAEAKRRMEVTVGSDVDDLLAGLTAEGEAQA